MRPGLRNVKQSREPDVVQLEAQLEWKYSIPTCLDLGEGKLRPSKGRDSSLRYKKQEMGKRVWCVLWVNPCCNWHWLDKNTREDIQLQGMDWQQVRKLRKRGSVSCCFSMVLKNTPSTTPPASLRDWKASIPFRTDQFGAWSSFLVWECCTSRLAKRKNTNIKDSKGSSAQKGLLKVWFSTLHQPTSKYPNLHSVHEKQGAGHLNIHRSKSLGPVMYKEELV